jgi:hypothetical protein
MQLACLGGSLSSLGPATAVNESVHQSKINLREVLSGLCYKQREKLWEFEVCPFHNVTQRQVRMKSMPRCAYPQQQPLVLMGCSQITGPNRYSGVLGLFQGWSDDHGYHRSGLITPGLSLHLLLSLNFRQAHAVQQWRQLRDKWATA